MSVPSPGQKTIKGYLTSKLNQNTTYQVVSDTVDEEVNISDENSIGGMSKLGPRKGENPRV